VTGERWEKIKAIFDSALELLPEDRGSFLHQACSGDDSLLIEIGRLLEEHEKAGGFLDDPLLSIRNALTPGEIIAGRYAIQRLLGRGGMGEVYEAHDQFLNERIALKTLRADLSDDPATLHRFQREIRTARKVTHPNVCRLFEVGVHDRGVHFFTMELLAGEPLSERIRRGGRLHNADAIPLIRQMAAGLQAAHDAGVIHCDFKSGNVILVGTRAVITDFGLAGLIPAMASGAPTVTIGTQLAGTIPYMSPEQMMGGEVTSASDIYSLGVVLFEMAAGRLPFEDRHLIRAAVERARGEVPSIRSFAPDIDPHWERAIGTCLQTDPKQRPRSAAAIALMLERRRTATFLPLHIHWPVESRRAMVVGAVSIAALGAGYGYWSLRRITFLRGTQILVADATGSNANLAGASTLQLRKSLAQSDFL
jgi:eukaryotic-like serine/threonine-protein kinase